MSLADFAADSGAPKNELVAAITAIALGDHGALRYVLPLTEHPSADVRPPP